jgi:hypothetical protein
VNEFLTWFPGVTREQVEAVLHGGVGPRILTLCRKGAPLTASFSRRRQHSLIRRLRQPRHVPRHAGTRTLSRQSTFAKARAWMVRSVRASNTGNRRV